MARGRDLVVRIIGDASSFSRSVRTAEADTARLDHSLNKAVRGVAAGSGAFTHLGRSVAFASGGFLAFAGVTDVIKKSIEAATEDAAAQRQLAAQFRANKQNLHAYSAEIKDASLHVSELSGFTETDLTQAFTTAFRVTNNVAKALKIQSLAADVARARNISLAQSAIALDRAFGGSATSLRRLGIIIPKNLKGMAALEYVQAKVAGQAQAGSTVQERFAAALHNTEITIGSALLPTFNRLLTHATKWLDKSKNQKHIQDDVNKGLSVGGRLLHGFSSIVGAFSKGLGPPIQQTVRFAHALERVNNAVAAGVHRVYQATPRQGSAEDVRLRGVANMVPGNGEDVRLRSGGFGTNPQSGPGARRVAASLDYQISRANLNLARAQVTAQTADDRAMLVRLAALTREKISKTKDLAVRTQLYQSLGSIEQQIRAIDDGNAAQRQAARKRELDAKKKEAAEAKKHAAKLLAERKKEAAARKKEAAELAAAQQKIQTAVATVRQNLQTSLDAVRSGIGQLFSGPILNPTDAQRKAALGVPNASPTRLVADIRAQTAQYARLQHDLRRLKRLGASKELVSELNQQGTSAIPQIEALLGNKRAARQFIGAFNQREKLALRTARMDVSATKVVVNTKELPPVHVVVELDGRVIAKQVTKQQQRKTRRQSAQSRGGSGGSNLGIH